MDHSISISRNTDTLFSRPFPKGMKKVRGKRVTKRRKQSSLQLKILVWIEEPYVLLNMMRRKRLVSIISVHMERKKAIAIMFTDFNRVPKTVALNRKEEKFVNLEEESMKTEMH